MFKLYIKYSKKLEKKEATTLELSSQVVVVAVPLI